MPAKQKNGGGNERKKRREEEDKVKEEEGEQPLTLLDLPRNVRQLIWKKVMEDDATYRHRVDIKNGLHIGLVSWVGLNASVCGCFLLSPLPSRLISLRLISNTNTDLQRVLRRSL